MTPRETAFGPSDLCAHCGAEPPLGLRRHPRFSIAVGWPEDGAQVVIYAHTRDDQLAVAGVLSSCVEVIAMQEWTGDRWDNLPVGRRTCADGQRDRRAEAMFALRLIEANSMSDFDAIELLDMLVREAGADFAKRRLSDGFENGLFGFSCGNRHAE